MNSSFGLKGLAWILAFMSVVLLTPVIDGYTAEFVRQHAARTYGWDIADLVRVVWAVCVAGLIFFTCLMSVETGLALLGTALALRFAF